jgi:beta-glucosidase-like glycosyl hydrolase
MNDEIGKIERLGIPAYRYGHEGLHSFLQPCVEPGDFEGGGRCFTVFPASSASVAAFNRSLWYSIGSAMSDESRGAWNDGYGATLDSQHEGMGLHIRGPQLNPQRDPRCEQD